MTRRLDKTLADYVGIAISPVLIMILVGSLLFFLVEVFYQGNYSGRLHWVLGCFTMGAVALGRVSIEEGKERAVALGIPLGIVTYIALGRFVQFHGGIVGNFSGIINLFLLGLVWWCAHKLTWDCTLIDETQDSSGEGLMQTVGLEEKAAHKDEPEPEKPEEPEGVTARDAKPMSWWDRFVERQRRPHAPGVWVVYFSLAALPLFGIGQWFIPRADTATRQRAFHLLFVYVASGMGLLLLTSFLGLRRYLRQRRIEMPAPMAGLWIAIGCALIVGLLLAATLLPRPGTGEKVASLPFSIGSPRHESSKYAITRGDPAEEDKGGPRSGSREDQEEAASEQQSGEGDSQKGSDSGGQKGEGDSQKGAESGEQKGEGDSQKGSDSGGQKSEGDSQKGSDSGGQKGEGESQKGSDSGGQKGEGESQKGSDSGAQKGEGESQKGSDSGGQKGEGESSSQSESGKQTAGAEGDSEEQGAESDRQEDQSGSRTESETAARDEPSEQAREQEEDRSRPSRGSSRRQRDRGSDQTETPESETAQDRSPRGGPPERPPLDPGALLQTATSWFGALFKWLMIALLVGVIGYFLWRSRAEVLQAIRDFFDGLRQFWQRLFGARSAAAAETSPEEAGPKGPRPSTFSDFTDPFAAGTAEGYSPDQLVRYTFDALEAWARDHGWPRGPEQTPHEFANDLGTRVEPLAEDVRRLADLYCRVAYASDMPRRKRVAPLKRLWQEMRHREPVTV